MDITQSYQLANEATQEILGESGIINEDYSNLVDIGESLFDAHAVDAYVRTLVNKVGKIEFVNKLYRGKLPSLLKTSWEFGSVLQRISMELPEASENESWELRHGEVYSNEVFYKPTITTTFYNKKTTIEVDMSITDMQVRQSFSSRGELNAFISMIQTAIENTLTLKIEALSMATLRNMIGETVYNEFDGATVPVQHDAGSGIRAVNLLYLYNTHFFGESTSDYITADEALTDEDFMRYATYIMGLYSERITGYSTLFNLAGKERFTDAEMLHWVLLADFEKGASSYLYSTTFNEQFNKLPSAEIVPFWQGSGLGYSFEDVANVKCTTASNNSIDIDGVVGVMFDDYAVRINCEDRRTTQAYNAKAEFTNSYSKYDMNAMNDLGENFVVFFIA